MSVSARVMKVIFTCILVAAALMACDAEMNFRGLNIPDEASGFVDVRDKAHMFWWLMGSSDTENRATLPLIMWLQGGPGGSSTGFGNYLEIGPKTTDGKDRDTTWLKKANLLFVDNPVGTGYSYVDDKSAYTTNVAQIAADLVTLTKEFVKAQPALSQNPFYIFSESYGGKMTATFGVALKKAIDNKELDLNFKGVVLGDSWVSPIDSVNSWAPYLRANAQVDATGESQLKESAQKIEQAVKDGKLQEATNLWGQMENQIQSLTDNVDFYNVLLHNSNAMKAEADMMLAAGPLAYLQFQHLKPLTGGEQDLPSLMNGADLKKRLNIPDNVTWGAQATDVFTYQAGDFMTDVIADVDTLISMGLEVNIESGQLDLICAALGTEYWIEKLKWSELKDFHSAPRTPVTSKAHGANTDLFVKRHKNFAYYTVNRAGHMVPADNGEGAFKMMTMITGQDQVVV